MAECDMLAQLRHPNVVQFFGVVLQSSGLPLLVTELMRESLQDRMRRSPALMTSEVIAVSHDVTNALDYIHGLEKPIAHRDLAPKNILLEYNPEIRAKIADLGVAKVMSSVDTQSANTRRPGTDHYMPPEAFVNGQYTLKIDVFSLGVIMLQMVVGRDPTPSSMWQPCGGGTFRIVPERQRRQCDLNDVPDDHPLRSLILQCLENERPSALEIADSIREIYTVESVGQDRSIEYVPAWKIKEIEDANKKKVETIEKECQETVDVCHSSLTAIISKLQNENESLTCEKEALQGTAEQSKASLEKMTKRWHEETSTLHDSINCKATEIGKLLQERGELKHRLELEQDQRGKSEQQLQTDFSMRLESSLIKAKLEKERDLAQVRGEMEGKHMAMLESLMTENEAAFTRSQELYEKERTGAQEEKVALIREVANLKIELERVKEGNATLQEKLDDAVMDSSETDRLKKQQDASHKAAMNLVRTEQRSAIKAVKRGFEAQKKKMADDFQGAVSTLWQGHMAREGELKIKLGEAQHKISILEGLLGELRQQLSWPVRGIML